MPTNLTWAGSNLSRNTVNSNPWQTKTSINEGLAEQTNNVINP